MIMKPENDWKFSSTITPPGIILLEEFVKPLNITAIDGVPLEDIIAGRREIDSQIAFQLSNY